MAVVMVGEDADRVGGGYGASILVQPNGVIDALIWGHQLDPGTFAVHPGHEYFISSADGGKTWSPAVEVGASAGSIAILTWWIDGDLSTDQAGNLYATWDTQTPSGDIGWLFLLHRPRQDLVRPDPRHGGLRALLHRQGA